LERGLEDAPASLWWQQVTQEAERAFERLANRNLQVPDSFRQEDLLACYDNAAFFDHLDVDDDGLVSRGGWGQFVQRTCHDKGETKAASFLTGVLHTLNVHTDVLTRIDPRSESGEARHAAKRKSALALRQLPPGPVRDVSERALGAWGDLCRAEDDVEVTRTQQKLPLSPLMAAAADAMLAEQAALVEALSEYHTALQEAAAKLTTSATGEAPWEEVELSASEVATHVGVEIGISRRQKAARRAEEAFLATMSDGPEKEEAEAQAVTKRALVSVREHMHGTRHDMASMPRGGAERGGYKKRADELEALLDAQQASFEVPTGHVTRPRHPATSPGHVTRPRHPATSLDTLRGTLSHHDC